MAVIEAVVAVNEFGPDQAYKLPPNAVRVTLPIVQLKFSVPVTLTVGADVSLVTEVVALAVQPLVVLVTVTV
jgi:hypothetical protein